MMWRERDRRRLSSNDERTPPAYQPARAEGFPVSGELCLSATSSDLVVGPVLGSSTHQSVSSFLRPELGAAFHIGGEFFKSKFLFQLLPGLPALQLDFLCLGWGLTGSSSKPGSHNSIKRQVTPFMAHRHRAVPTFHDANRSSAQPSDDALPVDSVYGPIHPEGVVGVVDLARLDVTQ